MGCSERLHRLKTSAQHLVRQPPRCSELTSNGSVQPATPRSLCHLFCYVMGPRDGSVFDDADKPVVALLRVIRTAGHPEMQHAAMMQAGLCQAACDHPTLNRYR